MIGVPAFLGTPSAPWHVLQTSNLAPRMTSASAVFPGEGSAGLSGMCPAVPSAAIAGAASTARTAKTVGRRLLIMFPALVRVPAVFECPRSRDATHMNMPQSGLWRKMARVLDGSEPRRKFETGRGFPAARRSCTDPAHARYDLGLGSAIGAVRAGLAGSANTPS